MENTCNTEKIVEEEFAQATKIKYLKITEHA
jgi:hypothetical protein